ncbi:MAG: signal transduction histidine kinase [Sphingomonas bacterium]|nr:signal transduction histidine kinase [Sphingomonas bacterium]MDB5718214.1 signal transduction histidine kinase [Sphingomonas bacterium]
MSNAEQPRAQLHGDPPAAATPQSCADRRELAFIAIERTRMPMVITNPREPDNPIVIANHAFLEMVGYSADEVLGRNCRFLQGHGTDPAAIGEVRAAITAERDVTVDLLNYRKDGTAFWNQLFVSPIHGDDGELLYFFASQLDVTQQRVAQKLEAVEHRLLREIDHRAKNALALVQGIVRLSRADDPAAYASAVQGRVDALARAHSLLADRSWQGAPLDRLIRGEIEPFGTLRVDFAGPPVDLAASQVQPLALLFHEMLANASQHGALSTPAGKIALRWTIDAENGAVNIAWAETDGPAPRTERATGFGSAMIDAIIRRQLGGTIESQWTSAGLRANIAIPQPARAEAA